MSRPAGEVIPFWKKKGAIQAPKMPASRVSSGLLMSLIVRTVHQESPSYEVAYGKIEDLIRATISCDELTVNIFTNRKKKSEVRINIYATKNELCYGYVLFVPKSWFTLKK